MPWPLFIVLLLPYARDYPDGLACLAAELSRESACFADIKKFLLEGCSHLCHIFLSVSLKNILYLGEGETYDIPPLLVVSPCFGSVVLVVVK